MTPTVFLPNTTAETSALLDRVLAGIKSTPSADLPRVLAPLRKRTLPDLTALASTSGRDHAITYATAAATNLTITMRRHRKTLTWLTVAAVLHDRLPADARMLLDDTVALLTAESRD